MRTLGSNSPALVVSVSCFWFRLFSYYYHYVVLHHYLTFVVVSISLLPQRYNSPVLSLLVLPALYDSLFSFTVQLSCVPLEPLRMSLRMMSAVHGGRSSSRTPFSFTDTKGASSGVMASLSKLTKRDYREERERLQTFRRPKNKATSKERTKSLKKGR